LDVRVYYPTFKYKLQIAPVAKMPLLKYLN